MCMVCERFEFILSHAFDASSLGRTIISGPRGVDGFCTRGPGGKAYATLKARAGTAARLIAWARVLSSTCKWKRSLASSGRMNGRTGAGRGLSSLLLMRAASMQKHDLRTSASAETADKICQAESLELEPRKKQKQFFLWTKGDKGTSLGLPHLVSLSSRPASQQHLCLWPTSSGSGAQVLLAPVLQRLWKAPQRSTCRTCQALTSAMSKRRVKELEGYQ